MSQQINLFNPIFLKQKRHFSAAAMAQALGFVAVGVLVMYGYELRQNHVLAVVAAQAERELDVRRDQLMRFAKESSSQAGNRALSEELSAAEARLAQRKGLLEDVKTGVGGDARGYSRYLTALAREAMPGVWLTGVNIDGKASALVIKGRALDSALVPAYLRALNREAPIAGQRVNELQLTAREGAKSAASAPAKDTPPASEPERFIEFSLVIPLRGSS